MEAREYTTIDRDALKWPSGEWDGEPDKVQWPDDETGMPCLAVRNPISGFWCGYVGVAPDHLLHGEDYDEVCAEVHGGLTFSGMCHPGETEGEGICHVPGEGEPDHVWWFGFDCAHAWDYSPMDLQRANKISYPFTISPEKKYRTLEYVKQECRNLARQLLQWENKA